MKSYLVSGQLKGFYFRLQYNQELSYHRYSDKEASSAANVADVNPLQMSDVVFRTASENVDQAAEPVAPLRKVKKKGKKGKAVDAEATSEGQAPPVPGGTTPTPVSTEIFL